LLDGQGLGHTPDSSTSVTTHITRHFAEIDAILLVDNAEQPAQAAAQSVLRAVASSKNYSKLLLAFTYFDQVKGLNLPTFVLGALDGSSMKWPPNVRAQLNKSLSFVEKSVEPPPVSDVMFALLLQGKSWIKPLKKVVQFCRGRSACTGVPGEPVVHQPRRHGEGKIPAAHERMNSGSVKPMRPATEERRPNRDRWQLPGRLADGQIQPGSH
jgi:hypothetical protein